MRVGLGSSALLAAGGGGCWGAPRRPYDAAADEGGGPSAPVRRGGAASSAEERSRRVASAEAIAVVPSAIGAAEGARSRSTHHQLTANEGGRDSGARERPRSRYVMREGGWASLPVGVGPTGKVRAASVEPAYRRAIRFRCVKAAHARTSSSALRGSQVRCERMRGDVRGLREALHVGQLGDLHCDVRHRVFCSVQAASRTEQGADLPESLKGRLVHDGN